MGSEQGVLTEQETLETLRISRRTLRKYVKDGVLHPLYQGLTPQFMADEVSTLLEVRNGTVSLTETVQRSVAALARIKQLETRVLLLEEVSQLHTPVLELNEEDLLAFWERAHFMLERSVCDADVVLGWARQILALGEEHLEMLEMLGCEAPWTPLLAVQKKLALARPTGTESVDPLVRTAWLWLEASRRHLRRVAFFHISNTDYALAKKTIPESCADVHDEVIAAALWEN